MSYSIIRAAPGSSRGPTRPHGPATRARVQLRGPPCISLKLRRRTHVFHEHSILFFHVLLHASNHTTNELYMLHIHYLLLHSTLKELYWAPVAEHALFLEAGQFPASWSHACMHAPTQFHVVSLIIMTIINTKIY